MLNRLSTEIPAHITPDQIHQGSCGPEKTSWTRSPSTRPPNARNPARIATYVVTAKKAPTRPIGRPSPLRRYA